jgi:hypothetical protein
VVRFFREASLVYFVREQTNFNKYIQSFQISGLRIAFSITKSAGWSTNQGAIKIWNLSLDHRNLMVNYGDQVILSAGYRDDGGKQIIYAGQTTSIIHSYEQPEIITTLECNDGDKFFNQLHGCGSYSKDVPARQVATDIAAQMGFSTIAHFEPSQNTFYPRGFSFSGPLHDALVDVCNFLNLQPVITNGFLYILPINSTRSASTYDVNENTGMQGVPERFISRRLWPYLALDAPTDGYKVNSALIPSIIVGDRVNLSSQRIGIANIPNQVITVRHLGDTFGPEWVTNLEMLRLKQ